MGMERFRRILREGIPYSSMPPFPDLKEEEIKALYDFLMTPPKAVVYGIKEIKKSRENYPSDKKGSVPSDPLGTVVLIDKGSGKVMIAEATRVLDSFRAPGVHGGVKFSPDLKRIYVPTRDGWIYLYDLTRGVLRSKVRACIYQRNIAAGKDRVVSLCLIPRGAVILDGELNPVRTVLLDGEPTAVYAVDSLKRFVITFRDRPLVAFIDPGGRVELKKVSSPLESFFIDPFEKYLIGSEVGGKRLVVYELGDMRRVFSSLVPSLPHLYAVDFWYRRGKFFFATVHRNSTKVIIWEMYGWRKVGEVEAGVKGSFVRTSPFSPYLWVDGGSGYYTLIERENLRVRRLEIKGEGKTTHVEFSSDGKFAYVSLLGKDGGFFIYDPATLELQGFIKALKPAGKYSPAFKVNFYRAFMLGLQVYGEKCWGCHNLKKEAFGPPFGKIARVRSEREIIAILRNPPERAMPSFRLTEEEKLALLYLFRGLKRVEGYAEGK
jgi:mono/diheme cytochrome c family protein